MTVGSETYLGGIRHHLICALTGTPGQPPGHAPA